MLPECSQKKEINMKQKNMIRIRRVEKYCTIGNIVRPLDDVYTEAKYKNLFDKISLIVYYFRYIFPLRWITYFNRDIKCFKTLFSCKSSHLGAIFQFNRIVVCSLPMPTVVDFPPFDNVICNVESVCMQWIKIVLCLLDHRLTNAILRLIFFNLY